MATYFPGGLFTVSSLSSPAMVLRDQRLKEAKQHAERSQRELNRDRMNLERKEKQLLQECKRLAKKGDMHGARLIANQIARFRRLHDRNLESAVLISTKSQSMVSDHKVNKAQMETVKGFAYANTYESFGRAEAREQRYAYRMTAINHLESSTKDAMDSLYRGEEDSQLARMTNTQTGCGEEDPREAQLVEYEIQSILHQAVHNGKHRVYVDPDIATQERHGSFSAITGQEPPITFADAQGRRGSVIPSGPPHVLHVKSMERPLIGTTLSLYASMEESTPFVPALATIDAVKRKLIQDTFATSQLNLLLASGQLKPFMLGRVVDGAFVPFDFSETLTSAGLPSGSTVHVKLLESPDSEEVKAPEVDGEIRERINLIRCSME